MVRLTIAALLTCKTPSTISTIPQPTSSPSLINDNQLTLHRTSRPRRHGADHPQQRRRQERRRGQRRPVHHGRVRQQRRLRVRVLRQRERRWRLLGRGRPVPERQERLQLCRPQRCGHHRQGQGAGCEAGVLDFNVKRGLGVVTGDLWGR